MKMIMENINVLLPIPLVVTMRICYYTVSAALYPLRKHAHAIYSDFFKIVKNENFQKISFDIFLIFAQNIDCGYSLELPRRGGSNEYLQSMFWSKNKKNRYTPAYNSFAIKVGL